MKRFLQSLLVVSILLALFIGYHSQDDAVMSTTEFASENEAAEIQRAKNNFIEVIKDTRSDYAARGAHAKGHACVKSYFNVSQDLAPELQHGVFQAGQSYKSWIRFSNGSPRIKKDADNDSRGIAIKLLNIRHPAADLNTQEFLLHNSPAFFSTDLKDYNALVESDDKIAYFLPGWNPLNWKLRELMHVFDTLAPPPVSPAVDQYFSNTAYKLGPHNVKYKVQACASEQASLSIDQQQPNFLRLALKQQLNDGDVCMQFSVQLQKADKHMPIEDPSILWQTSESRFIPIAQLILPKQDFDSVEQLAFCEQLSFSPWHSLEAHRPIGVLNRVRKIVYAASSAFRHQQNNTQIPTNLDW